MFPRKMIELGYAALPVMKVDRVSGKLAQRVVLYQLGMARIGWSTSPFSYFSHLSPCISSSLIFMATAAVFRFTQKLRDNRSWQMGQTVEWTGLLAIYSWQLS